MAYRLDERASDAAILLVTSRDTGRWLIPKGNLIAGKPPHSAAAIEAEEEAGVRGTVGKTPIGHYSYRKWISAERYALTAVDVYLLKVTTELKTWKEQAERERRWVGRAEAANMVDEPELRALILAANLP